MKKLIATLALVLLFTASAQAATIVVDENFDSAAEQVNVDTLLGWTNIGPAGEDFEFRTTQSGEGDGGTIGIEKKKSGGNWGSYSYDVSHTLGAGESYRFEAYLECMDVWTGTSNLLRLYNAAGDRTQFYYDTNAELDWAIYTAGGSKVHNDDVFSSSTKIRVAWDISPTSITAWYDLTGGTSWTKLGTDSSVGLGDIKSMNVQFYTAQTASKVRADSLSLTVIPEPATMGLLIMGALALLRRRR